MADFCNLLCVQCNYYKGDNCYTSWSQVKLHFILKATDYDCDPKLWQISVLLFIWGSARNAEGTCLAGQQGLAVLWCCPTSTSLAVTRLIWATSAPSSACTSARLSGKGWSSMGKTSALGINFQLGPTETSKEFIIPDTVVLLLTH